MSVQHACEHVRVGSDFPQGHDGLELPADRFMGSTGSQAVQVSTALREAGQHVKNLLSSESQEGKQSYS